MSTIIIILVLFTVEVVNRTPNREWSTKVYFAIVSHNRYNNYILFQRVTISYVWANSRGSQNTFYYKACYVCAAGRILSLYYLEDASNFLARIFPPLPSCGGNWRRKDETIVLDVYGGVLAACRSQVDDVSTALLDNTMSHRIGTLCPFM